MPCSHSYKWPEVSFRKMGNEVNRYSGFFPWSLVIYIPKLYTFLDQGDWVTNPSEDTPVSNSAKFLSLTSLHGMVSVEPKLKRVVFSRENLPLPCLIFPDPEHMLKRRKFCQNLSNPSEKWRMHKWPVYARYDPDTLHSHEMNIFGWQGEVFPGCDHCMRQPGECTLYMTLKPGWTRKDEHVDKNALPRGFVETEINSRNVCWVCVTWQHSHHVSI